jgi:5'-3' exonuclease
MEQLSLFSKPEPVKVVKKNTMLIIDGNNLLNRCYYASAHNPRGLMKAPNGKFINGVSGFLRTMFKYMRELQASQVAVCFDQGKGFRKELYPEYKDGRNEQPDSLNEQFPLLKSFLSGIGVPIYQSKKYEADDIISRLTQDTKRKHFVLSNDKDLLQLVEHNTTVIARKKKDDVFYTPEKFSEEYQGLIPKQIIDLKAIMGDSSDNIPGVHGIGEKGAFTLIKEFGDIENMISSIGEFPKPVKRYEEKIADNIETLRFSLKLTKLVHDLNIEEHEFNGFDVTIYKTYCKSLALNSLIKELDR